MAKLKTLFLIVLSLGFFLLPMVFWPWAQVVYEVPRVWFFCRWIEVLTIISLFIFKINNLKKRQAHIVFLIFLFFLIATLSSLFGVDIKKSLTGNFFRWDGLTTYFHFFILFLLITLFWQEEWKKYLTIVFISTSSLISLLAVGSAVLRKGLIVAPIFGQPVFLAGYLLITFPFLFYLFKTSRFLGHKLIIGFLMLLQSTAICLTGALGAVLGLVIFIVLVIVAGIKKAKRFKIIFGVLFFIFILGTSLLIIKYKNRGDFVAESRQRIFTKIILGWTKRPFFGYGWANVDYAFEASIWPIELTQDVYVDKAHSTLLETLATTGIIGLISYLSIIFLSIKRLIFHIENKKNRLWWKTIFLVFILYLFHSQTNVISISEEVFFWFILGLTTI